MQPSLPHRLLLLLALTASTAFAGGTEVLTVAITPSTEPGGGGSTPAISADGRFVVFRSPAPNLVAGDENAVADIFVYDRTLDVTTLVSVDSTGIQATQESQDPRISGNGRYVVFTSLASNLVPGDTPTSQDVFLHDLQTGTTEFVALSSAGDHADGDSSSPSISADGRFVAFASWATNLVSGDTNGQSDVFVRDRQAGTTTRISLATGGEEGNGWSEQTSISADGRYVAFVSSSTNLVPGDANATWDVFVHDRQTSVSTRASISDGEVEADADSWEPALSEAGRYVAFHSNATNLTTGDTNGQLDVFVRDLQAATTIRVSVDSAGAQGDSMSFSPAISGDGRYVFFHSFATNLVANDLNGGSADVFRHDLQDGSTLLVSVPAGGGAADGDSYEPASSSDGRIVAFWAYATNLVAGDTNVESDVFVRDLLADSTERTPDVGVPPPGGALLLADAAGVTGRRSSSSDGRFVVFASEATNLVPGDTNGVSDVFVRDRQLGITLRASVATGGGQGDQASGSPAISADGRYVAFVSSATNLVDNDENGAQDVFIYDRLTATTSLISINPAGSAANGPSIETSLSSDGRYVAFTSFATDLVGVDTNNRRDVFVRDRNSGMTVMASVDSAGVQGNNGGSNPAISGDGGAVAFGSTSSNLVPGDSNGTGDVFVRNLASSSTTRVSVDSSGLEGNGNSRFPDISADGRFVAFESSASNLVGSDSNGSQDIFIHDRQAGATIRASVDSGGAEADRASSGAALSASGRFVAFASNAMNLVGDDGNGRTDVFVHDRATRQTWRGSVDSRGGQGWDGASNSASLSGDGRSLVFVSAASTLVVGGDYNGLPDVFVHDMFSLFSDGFETGSAGVWHWQVPE